MNLFANALHTRIHALGWHQGALCCRSSSCAHTHTQTHTHTHTHAGAGDQTVLGGEEHRSTVHGAPDATVTLSQAQLVLVALARAVYKDAAVYLLDGVCMCGVCMCVYATERVSCVGGWIDP